MRPFPARLWMVSAISRWRWPLAFVATAGLAVMLSHQRERSIRWQLDDIVRLAIDDAERAEAKAAELTGTWTLQADATWVARGVCFLRMGQVPEAYGCWARVKNPQSTPSADLLSLAEAAVGRDNRLAWLALEAADRPEVVRRDWLVAALNAPPPPAGRYAEPGEEAWERELLELSTADDGPAWLAVAESRWRQGRFAASATAFGTALSALHPPLPEKQWRAAATRGLPLLVETGQLDLAREPAERARAVRPRPAALSYALAVLDRADGRLGDALAEAREAHKEATDNPRNACLLGRLLQETGRVEEAERVLRTAIDKFPRVPEPRHRLARLLRQTGRVAEADTQDASAQELAAGERRRLNTKGEAPRDASPIN